MRKLKYLSIVVVGIMSMIILTACGGETNTIDNGNDDEIEIIRMNVGDISLAANFDQLVSRSTHIMRVDVLDARVERVENPVNKPRSAWIERAIALEWRQDIIDDWMAMGETDSNPPHPPIVRTIYKVQVLEIFRELVLFHEGQPAVGDIIEVVRYGGLYDQQFWLFGGAELAVDSEYILFLDRCWQYAHRFNARPIQGVYWVPETLAVGQDLVEYDDIMLEIESAGWANDFEVTVEDFIDLANRRTSGNDDDQGTDGNNYDDQGIDGDDNDDDDEDS